MNKLPDLLRKISQGIEKKEFDSEAAVSHQIVTPVLATLGWDRDDPNQVKYEYPVVLCGGKKIGKVDIAILDKANKKLEVIIEVKGLDIILDEWEYKLCGHAKSSPLAILTNGKEWRFYAPDGKEDISNRLICKVDIKSKMDFLITEQVLTNLLSMSNVIDGTARAYAERAIGERLQVTEAIIRISEKRPEDLIALLQNLIMIGEFPRYLLDKIKDAAKPKIKGFIFDGEKHEPTSGIGALKGFIKKIEEVNPDFVIRFMEKEQKTKMWSRIINNDAHANLNEGKKHLYTEVQDDMWLYNAMAIFELENLFVDILNYEDLSHDRYKLLYA